MELWLKRIFKGGGDISSVTMTTEVQVALSGTATLGTDYAPSSSPITLTIPKGNYTTATTLELKDLTTSADSVYIKDDFILICCYIECCYTNMFCF